MKKAVVWSPALLLYAGIALAAGPRNAPDGYPVMTIAWLAAGGGACVAMGVAAYALKRLHDRRRRYSHELLFQGLCRIHSLDRAARGLLRQVARLCNLGQPARLFTEPKWLDPATLQRILGPRAAEASALRAQLFCDSEDPGPAS